MTALEEQLHLLTSPVDAARDAAPTWPQELRADHERLPSIRLPEASSVPMTRRVQSLLDHPAMQRLRRVRQLGPMHMLYPGATHTRFEHSLGVFANAREYLTHLMRHSGFSQSAREVDLLSLLAAALLHDVGHYPFSHSIEALHHKGQHVPHHAEITARMIRGEIQLVGERPLYALLREEWGVNPERVIGLITGRWDCAMDPLDGALRSVLASAIDANKMDYLYRDAHHMGLPYGKHYDRQRLLSSLTLTPMGDRIAIMDKGRVSAEMFIFSRYTMYSEAYWHHTVRAANVMVEAAFDAFQSCTQFDPEDLLDALLRHDDEQLLDWLRAQTPERSATRYLIGGMSGYRRALYKRVLTLSRASGDWRRMIFERLWTMTPGELYGLTDRLRVTLSSALGHPLHPADLIIDVPAPRDLRPRRVDVVYAESGEARAWPLHEISSIVAGIERDFAAVIQKIRLFAEPRLAARLEAHPHAQDLIVDEIMR